jgi:putative phosphoesterase
MLIGLISDTHQPSDCTSLWQEARQLFAGVDLILHAGDIVHPMVLDWLQEIAPVLAARGNNDIGVEDSRIEEMQVLDIEGRRIVMVHDLHRERTQIEQMVHGQTAAGRPDVIIGGHTHFERLDYSDGVLQINAGSATLPHQMSTRLGTAGLLEIGGAEVRARVVRLGHTEGKRNPGVEYSYTPETGVINLG